MQITGTELKLERVKAHVTIIDLAARMGLSRQSISVLEHRERVDPDRATRYREALATFSEVMSHESVA